MPKPNHLPKSRPVADFIHYPLSGGIDLYLLPTKRFKTITFKIYFYRPLDEKITASSLLVQVMRRGSRKYSTTRKILTFLEDCYGAALNMAVLKVGERHVLYFKLEAISDRYLPRGRNEDRVLKFLKEMVLNPAVEKGGLRTDYVEQEKRNLRHLIEGLIDDRMEYAHQRLIDEMCRGESYGHYELGRVDAIDRLGEKELLEHHADTLRTAPMTVLASGDFKADTMARKLARALSIRKRRVQPLPPAKIVTVNGAPREVIERKDVEQAKLVIGCRTGTTMASEEYDALLMYNALLGSFPHSRLFVNVREKENLAYFAHSMVEGSKGLMFISCGIDFAAYDKCLPVIRAQMEDLCAGNIGDEEWDKSLKSMEDRILKWNDDPSVRMGAFTEMMLNGVPRTPAEIIQRLRSLSREQVAAAGRKIKWDTIYFLTRP